MFHTDLWLAADKKGQQGCSRTLIHPDIINARPCAFTTVWLLQSVILPRPAQVLLANERLDADVDLNRIAEATDSFSGSDLNALCTAAAMIPVRELLKATGKSAQASAHIYLCRTLHLISHMLSRTVIRASLQGNYCAGSRCACCRWWVSPRSSHTNMLV